MDSLENTYTERTKNQIEVDTMTTRMNYIFTVRQRQIMLVISKTGKGLLFSEIINQASEHNFILLADQAGWRDDCAYLINTGLLKFVKQTDRHHITDAGEEYIKKHAEKFNGILIAKKETPVEIKSTDIRKKNPVECREESFEELHERFDSCATLGSQYLEGYHLGDNLFVDGCEYIWGKTAHDHAFLTKVERPEIKPDQLFLDEDSVYYCDVCESTNKLEAQFLCHENPDCPKMDGRGVEQELAEVLPFDSKWTAKAAAADAMARVNNDSACFLSVWKNADGTIHYSRHLPEINDYCLLLQVLQTMLNQWIETITNSFTGE